MNFSLFADLDGLPCSVTYGLGYAVWKKSAGNIRTRLTAFVPMNIAARVLLIEAEGAGDAAVRHFCRLVMGNSDNGTRHVETSFDARARHPDCAEPLQHRILPAELH
jgi:cellobiose phosphorylase